MQKKVLIVDKMHESVIPLMEREGFSVDYQPEISRKEIIDLLPGYTGMIIRSKTKVDDELLANASELRFIGRAGAGVDNLNMSAIGKKNIRVINAPEGNRTALAEHTIGMILALLHRLHISNTEVKGGIWRREENRGFELRSKTVGIFGYGHMGSALAERLKSFGCPVVAYDKYKRDFGDAQVEEVDIDTFKTRTEILSIHVPLTSETRALVNYEFLTSFPNLFMVVNTARGEVLRLQDLDRMMEEEKLWGAAFDVLENEKLDKLSTAERKIMNRLIRRDTVLFTPHIAGWTHESYQKISEVLVDKISKLKL